MSSTLLAQFVALSTGLLLLTSVLQLWRRSLAAAIWLLAIQGVGLASLVATLAVNEGSLELAVVAALVLAVKTVAIPMVLTRTAKATGATSESAPLMNPTASLLSAAALVTVAYLASRPLVGSEPSPTAQAVPVGIALVLVGFLVLLTRREAISQLVGFVVLDNGIATVAFLTSGGVPLVVELGVMLDVLLVVLILRVLAGRLVETFQATDLDDLTELRD